MTDAFVGEIRLYPYTLVPKGWLVCEGQILQITKYQVLYSILGPNYGGNGTTTFALPDLRGRVIVGVGADPKVGTHYYTGNTGGQESVTLTPEQMAPHHHMLQCTDEQGTQVPAANGIPATVAQRNPSHPPPLLRYQQGAAPTSLVALSPAAVSTVGNAAPVNNSQKTLPMHYCICNSGVYPSRP